MSPADPAPQTSMHFMYHFLAVGLLVAVLPASALSSTRMPEPAAEAEPVPGPDRRLHIGMWTMHLRDTSRGIDNNWLVGVSYNGIYGVTFVNSFGNRAFSAGYQNGIVGWDSRAGSLGLGYRLGVVTGYDERFGPLARRSPVIPIVQPRVTFDRQRIGAELAYAGVVASAGISVRF